MEPHVHLSVDIASIVEIPEPHWSGHESSEVISVRWMQRASHLKLTSVVKDDLFRRDDPSSVASPRQAGAPPWRRTPLQGTEWPSRILPEKGHRAASGEAANSMRPG